MTRPIVLCIGEDPTSTYVYQAIRNLGVTHVIKEDGPAEVRPDSINEWMRQSYVRFMSPLMRRFSRQRVRELQARYPLNDNPIPSHHLLRVTSLNDARTMMWLDRLQPQLVILHETGSVDMSRLHRLDCPILTVSPSMAKGQLEAYWAFRAKPDVCEVKIEQWGDRGWTVLDRSVLYVGGTDNFATYPYLQLVTALPLLRRQIESMLEEDVYDRRTAE
ncbi:hypothetical protein EVJ27_08220 [Exiguobacterium sp. SH3S2]|uniref:hypothetical protein n=1 Tax=unclassified Exiguobacterium TaxID=2644629 RepID=UPI001038E629|nr:MULTISPECIES: hypothetical protein [unclassified Exiguobacterium]TCI44814.1 hypothetical protein EVJ28_08220 [Exiguobacterium sp. SH3S3]TCI60235.1 hypothetical protein EVJ27_08220 [Exiguobacterium sp. SH3S2]